MHKLISFLVFILLTQIYPQQKVYHAFIDGDIDLGLAPYVKRVVKEAEANHADAIIFEINTFGGRVDAATQIKDAILNSKIETIAFINKRAISAGALISLSCQKIIMVPGASIGATTVVDQGGNKVSEKHQSYMRSEMRATSEKNGRRTDIAEGMVDERVVVEGLVDSTQLITLTSEEAIQYGIADTLLTDIDSIISYLGPGNVEIIVVNVSVAEKIVRFLNNPMITSLLIMIGMVGLFAEVKTPGWGLPGTAALIALALFFGSSFILDLASVFEILLFVTGVGFLIAEIFFIPGFGIFGVLGIIFMVGSLFMGLVSDLPYFDLQILELAISQLAGAFVMSFILIIILYKFLPKTTVWSNFVLSDQIKSSSGYTSKTDIKNLIGLEGKAITDLRPSGKAIINNKRIDVVSNGSFITKGSKLKVIEEEGSKVVVEKSINLS